MHSAYQRGFCWDELYRDKTDLVDSWKDRINIMITVSVLLMQDQICLNTTQSVEAECIPC